jgi:hypothetical protein
MSAYPCRRTQAYSTYRERPARLYQRGQLAFSDSFKMPDGPLTKSRPSLATRVTNPFDSAGRSRAVASPEGEIDD